MGDRPDHDLGRPNGSASHADARTESDVRVTAQGVSARSTARSSAFSSASVGANPYRQSERLCPDGISAWNKVEAIAVAVAAVIALASLISSWL